MASLFVIQGADQGKRFEFKSGPVALGRDSSNPMRLHDTEVSRRHAEVRPVDRLSDRRPGSANGRSSTVSPSTRPCCSLATGSSSARRSWCSTRGAPMRLAT